MKFRNRFMVLILALAMLVSGSGISVFAGADGEGSGNLDVSAQETVMTGADAEGAEEAEADASEKASVGGSVAAEEGPAAEPAVETKEQEDVPAGEIAAEEKTDEPAEEAAAETDETDEEEELKLVKQTIEADVITEEDKKKAKKTGTPAIEVAKEEKEKNPSDKDSKEVTLKGVMPEGAVATAEEAKDEKESYNFVTAYDITIFSDEKYDDASVWQPESGIKVEVSDESLSKLEDGSKVNVFHIAEGGSEPEFVCEATVKDGKVRFTAESFSIYGIETQNGRIGYRFWYPDEDGKYQLITTEYFKYNDVHEGDMRIYGPKIPGTSTDEQATLFKSWNRGSVDPSGSASLTSTVTIDELNTELVAMDREDYVDGTLTDIIAELNAAYYITYVDVNPNNVLYTEFVTKETSGDTTFTVSESAKPTVYEENLDGWVLLEDIDDPSAQVYEPGQSYTVNSNITLAPVISGGHWLIFNDNDLIEKDGEMVSGGASYTPPQFYMNTTGNVEVTERPADPEWTGYEFGGWYKDADCTQEFTFGNPLTANTTVYAKWTPSDTSFTIVVWKQRASDDPDATDDAKSYDYVSSARITEDIVTGITVSLDDYPEYKNIYGASGTSSDHDKRYYSFNASSSDASIMVKGDGSSVLNVYYDRAVITMNFNTWETEGYVQNNNGNYGLVGDTYVNISRSGGRNYYLTYSDGTPVPADTRVYYRTGLIFTRWASTTSPAYNTRYYSEEDYDTELTWTQYTGQRYAKSNRGSWQPYKTYTGLYGATLAGRGYTWPSEYDWYSTGGNNGSTSGTRTTILVAFLPSGEDSETMDFYGSAASGTVPVVFYTQNLDGSYSEANRVNTSGNNFNITDKYTGFHAVQYRRDGGNWQSVGARNPVTGYYGSPVSVNDILEIRFDRDLKRLNFVTNNSAGETKTHTGIPYGTPLSDFANENPGQNTGYYFEGWYEDRDFAVPFDFETKLMGTEDVTAFGKWRMLRTRVVIDPVSDGGPENADLGSQALAFRIDYGERIDGGLLETATRPGYILDGWYTDPEFRNKFLFTSPVTTETSGIDMTYQTAAKWNSARVGYGDDSAEYSNVRGILVLYARWIVNTDERGTNVVYDAGEAAETDAMGNVLTTVPIDHSFYQEGTEVLVREAPTGYSDLYEFDCWEVINSDGSVFKTDLHPGQSKIDLDDMPAYSTVDDEGGNPIQKTVRLRAKYTLSEEAEKRFTTLTYDGNTFEQTMYDGTVQTLRGRAIDGTNSQRVLIRREVNETVALPGDGDFYLTGYKLKGWSFTEGNGQTKHFDKDQLVYADNLDDADEPLNTRANTLYAMWEPKTYTVNVHQVVEEGVTDRSFSYQYKYGAENAIPSAASSKTLTNDESFTVTDETAETGLFHYDLKGTVFCITKPVVAETKDYSVRISAKAKLDDGSTVTIDPQQIGTTFNGYRIVGDIDITITYSPKVEVTFAKRDVIDKTKVLTGAVLTLTPVEFNQETQKWDPAGESTDIAVNAATVTKKLQEGVYRVTEKTAPEDYAKITEDIYLTVTKDADFAIRTSSGGAVSDRIAELSKLSGASYKTLLTVFDNPIRTVTLKKTVEGSSMSSGFDFMVTVSKMESDGEHRLGNYDIGAGTTNNIGELEVTVFAPDNGSDSVELKIPDGYKLEIEEDIYGIYYTTHTVGGGEINESRKCIIDPVDGDTTVEFTNVCIPAPTAVNQNYLPFILILLAGAAVTAVAIMAKRRNRKGDDE